MSKLSEIEFRKSLVTEPTEPSKVSIVKTPTPTPPSAATTFVLLGLAAFALALASCPNTSSTGQIVCAVTGGSTILAAAIKTFGWKRVRRAMKLLVDAIKSLRRT